MMNNTRLPATQFGFNTGESQPLPTFSTSLELGPTLIPMFLSRSTPAPNASLLPRRVPSSPSAPVSIVRLALTKIRPQVSALSQAFSREQADAAGRVPSPGSLPVSALTLALAVAGPQLPILSQVLPDQQTDPAAALPTASQPFAWMSSPSDSENSLSTVTDENLSYLPSDMWRSIGGRGPSDAVTAMPRANSEPRLSASATATMIHLNSEAHLAAAVEAYPFMEKVTIAFEATCYPRGWESLAPLEKLANLRELNIATPDFLDEELHSLARLKNIETLTFNNCAYITDAGLEALATLPRLQTVKFFGCLLITGSGPAMLAQRLRLRELVVSDCLNFRPSTLESVSRMPELKTLTFDGPLSLERLQERAIRST